MLTRRYVERTIKKRAYFNPNNNRLYAEGIGLMNNCASVAQAVCLALSKEMDALYLMPALGLYKDARGRYPGKADWQATGLNLIVYQRNHSATIGTGDREIDIVPIGIWFSVSEDTHMSDVVLTMAHLKDLLTKHFQPLEVHKEKHDEYRVELQLTPAWTAMDLLRRKLPYGAKYDDLPQDIEHILMTQFGQARNELFHHDQSEIEHLYNYDGLWMYASCCRHMPVGRVVHDNVDRYDPYISGFYHVEVRIPDNWHHVGILPVRNPAGGGSIFPNKPGEMIRSWCSHRQLKLAIDQGWEVVIILERILWPDSQAKGLKIGQDPLRHWMQTLVELRQEKILSYKEPIRGMLKDGLRNFLNMGIGRLHMGAKTVDVYTQDWSEDPGEGALLAEEYIDGSFRYTKKEELNSYQRESFKPHWAVSVWKEAEWKVTRAALEVPYESLVSIRTDGLWTTCPVPFPNTGKPGCFREKELTYTGPFAWPQNDLEFVQMIQRARHG